MSESERTLAWLEQCVAPSVRALWQTQSHARILVALGLQDEADPRPSLKLDYRSRPWLHRS